MQGLLHEYIFICILGSRIVRINIFSVVMIMNFRAIKDKTIIELYPEIKVINYYIRQII